MKKERVVEERIGTAVKTAMYQKLQKIARMLGRTKSDLLKEGIWEVIHKAKTKN
jgi:predicted DNA-binding protein